MPIDPNKQLHAGMSVDEHLAVAEKLATQPHLRLSIYLNQAQTLTRALNPGAVRMEAYTIATVLDALAMRIPRDVYPDVPDVQAYKDPIVTDGGVNG